MHLLVTQPGQISDGDEAVDLGQTPGDIVFLSAASSDLSSLAEARRTRLVVIGLTGFDQAAARRALGGD